MSLIVRRRTRVYSWREKVRRKKGSEEKIYDDYLVFGGKEKQYDADTARIHSKHKISIAIRLDFLSTVLITPLKVPHQVDVGRVSMSVVLLLNMFTGSFQP
jgi:hypothetical protein